MKNFRTILYAALAACVLGCASSASPAQNAAGANAPTLDEAIADIAAHFADRLPASSNVAIIGFEADTESLSDYTAEELWNRFEQAGTFVMVDRQNLEKIRTEMSYQMSGEVSDESARSIGKQFGVQYIVYGRVTRIGGEYRISAYATDVEKAISTMRALTVRADERLSGLLSGESAGLESEIDRAVNNMGRSITSRMTIGIGRISLNGTGTLTSFSDWLKRAIVYSASQRRNKYEVADDSLSGEYAVSQANLTRDIFVEMEGPPEIADAARRQASPLIQGVVEGDFSPLGEDVQVTLRLVSASDNTVLGSSRFVIPASELDKRRLSLYPQKGGATVTRAEFEATQEIIAPFDGKNNAFGFTVKGDDLDGVYYEGEYMTMRLYAEKDCYFKILHVNVNGNVQVLYPRSPRDDNFIRAGETRRIPDNTRFRIAPPFGEEHILAAAYGSRFEAVAGVAAPLSSSGLSRDIVVEDEETRREMRPLATAKFSYTTLPQYE